MSNYSILKIEKIKSPLNFKVRERHNFRQIPVPNADINRQYLNKTLVNDGITDYLQLWKERQYEVNITGGKCKPREGAVYAYEIILGYTHDAIENEKVVAIGEIGLDYYYDAEYKELQKKWFKRQIELANELKLPIIIHDRDAHGDTFEIIKSTKSPEIGCVLHCYSGNVELAREYVKMGCYISIPGTVTFKNNKKTREVAKEIPLEYLLIETDSPYMAPEPHRGKRNDPSLVAFVADKIAQEKGISYEKVCEATKENAKRLFNIK